MGAPGIDLAATALIPTCAIVAIIFGLWLWKRVAAVQVSLEILWRNGRQLCAGAPAALPDLPARR